MVESAILFPVLMLLVLGSADLGRVFYYSIAITNAAREGARQGSYYDPGSSSNPYATHAAVITAVQAEARDLTLVEPNPPGSPVNCQVGPPYTDSYYPSAPNTGYVFACFNEVDGATSGTPGQTIRVTILYTFAPVTPMVSNYLGASVHVQSTAVMVIQGQP